MRAERSHGALMDQVYRRQRHIYNLTRRYYLIGRDDLIRGLDLHPGDRVVEIGCGTARNLIAIARRYPGAQLFGLDASGEMLATAEDAVSRAGLSRRIMLKCGLAEEMSSELFGDRRGFEAAIFSYSLSMIPDWRGAIAAAARALTESGRLHIVDFGDFGGLPGPVSAGLGAWLRKFHVAPRIDLLRALERTRATGSGHLRLYPGRYAFCWRGAELPEGVLANVAGPPQAAEIS
jgi:S-adenosylmethionine-diacylgycerolhomoserine-N-methlytransferase